MNQLMSHIFYLLDLLAMHKPLLQRIRYVRKSC